MNTDAVDENIFTFDYHYDSLGRRDPRDQSGGDYWLFQYDSLNQLDTARKYNDNDVLLPGYNWDFTFDDIGNRKKVKNTGFEADYTVSDLNQIGIE